VENLKIEGTENSPGIEFDFQANVFSLRGMSFMEDVNGFYDPLIETFQRYVEALNGAAVQFDFSLSYFNSSTARIVLMLFDMLDLAAEGGNEVIIRWHHDGDEDMIEQGEEFGEDLEHAQFSIVDDQADEIVAV